MALKSPIRKFLSLPLGDLVRPKAAVLGWIIFCLMAAASALLSFFPLSTAAALWTFFLGLLIPAGLFLLLPEPKEKNTVFFNRESLPSVPAWIWILVVALAVFLRLDRLTSLSSWPTVDEGVLGHFALGLSRQWNWELLENNSQLPTLYSWGQALLFKVGGPGLFTLWLYPALWSLACLPAAWILARKIFSKSMGFLVLFLAGTSFWPLYLGRLSVEGGFLFFGELICLLALMDYCGRSGKKGEGFRLFVLNLITGLGFYTYLAWPLVAMAAAAALLFRTGIPAKKRFLHFLLFCLGTALLLLPLALAYRREYLGYFNHVWAGDRLQNFFQNLPLGVSYFRGLFWGLPGVPFYLGGFWGGLFNPLADALIFLGALAVLKRLSHPLGRFILAASAIFFLPALLTTNLEMMRLVTLCPVLLALAGLGLHALLLNTPPSWRTAAASVVLTGSLALSWFHFLVVYPAYWQKNPGYYRDHKSAEYDRAYLLLKKKARAEGPGLILLNFVPDPYDQTLKIAVDPFNALENPKLNPEASAWMGLLANVNTQPYLSSRFPEGKWFWLSQGLNRPDGGLLLALIPLSPANRTDLEGWSRADQSLEPLVD